MQFSIQQYLSSNCILTELYYVVRIMRVKNEKIKTVKIEAALMPILFPLSILMF